MAEKWKRHKDEGLGEGTLVALGAAGGLALGLLLSGRLAPPREVGARLRERAHSAAERLRPGRLRREVREQLQFTALEDAVLDAFLQDDVLSERGIDVGCISRGIIELSGSVRTADEADRAVRLAGGTAGVETVVNRMDLEDDLRRLAARGGSERGERMPGGEWTGRQSGMGRRRQGGGTEPDRADDSQHIREVSLEHDDRQEFEEEGYGHSQPRMGASPEPLPENPTNYAEDELDNQSPFGKHVADPQLGQPQELNSAARVGEGLKPGTELRLEQSDVPVKPHGQPAADPSS